MKFELLIGVVGTITLSGLLIVFNTSSPREEESAGSGGSKSIRREEKELEISRENIDYKGSS